MRTLLDHPKAGLIFTVAAVAGLLVFGFAIGVLMTPYTEVIGMERLGELTCLQMAGTSERAVQVLTAFNAEELGALRGLLIPGDVTFAWGYGLVFSGLLGLLTLRLKGNWRSIGGWLMWAPLAASVFDVLEDLGLHSIVSQMAAGITYEINPAIPAATMFFAATKYLLLAVIGPLYGIAGSVTAFGDDRRLRSVVLYLLVVLTALSMVQKPAMEIPACFG